MRSIVRRRRFSRLLTMRGHDLAYPGLVLRGPPQAGVSKDGCDKTGCER
jgi:hypothetical protein